MQKAELIVAGVLFYQQSGTPLGQLYESLGLPSGPDRSTYRYFGIDIQEPPDHAEQIVLPYGFSPNTLEVMRNCDQYFFPVLIERTVAFIRNNAYAFVVLVCDQDVDSALVKGGTL